MGLPGAHLLIPDSMKIVTRNTRTQTWQEEHPSRKARRNPHSSFHTGQDTQAMKLRILRVKNSTKAQAQGTDLFCFAGNALNCTQHVAQSISTDKHAGNETENAAPRTLAPTLAETQGQGTQGKCIHFFFEKVQRNCTPLHGDQKRRHEAPTTGGRIKQSHLEQL